MYAAPGGGVGSATLTTPQDCFLRERHADPNNASASQLQLSSAIRFFACNDPAKTARDGLTRGRIFHLPDFQSVLKFLFLAPACCHRPFLPSPQKFDPACASDCAADLIEIRCVSETFKMPASPFEVCLRS